MSKIEAILADAAELSVADRLELIEALWETVPERELPPLSDEWREEINRRSAEFDKGTMQGIPWSEIKADALGRIRRQGD